MFPAFSLYERFRGENNADDVEMIPFLDDIGIRLVQNVTFFSLMIGLLSIVYLWHKCHPDFFFRIFGGHLHRILKSIMTNSSIHFEKF